MINEIRMKRIVFVCLMTGAVSETVTQYMGMGPNDGVVGWLKGTFPSNYTATSASQVTIETVEETNDEIGIWYNLDMEGEPLLTIKHSGDYLYSQLNTGIAPSGPSDDGQYPGGCCVDRFKVWNKNTNGVDEKEIDWDIESLIWEIYANSTDTDKDSDDGNPFAYANHVFDITSIDNTVYAMIDVTYHEPDLEFSEVDSVVFFDPHNGTILPTADGENFFSFYQHLGTTSTTTSDSIYKIMYESGGPEQFHMNGITRFQTNDGTWILGATFRSNAEAILIKCPYTYKASDGGGTILQRFGTPTGHRFGYSVSDPTITALHNLYYTNYKGVDQNNERETISLFVNDQDGYTNSRLFEFDLNLVSEPINESYDDTIFDTTYVTTGVGFFTDMWGGVRPIGQNVWLVGFNAIQVVDMTTDNEINVNQYDNKEQYKLIEENKEQIRMKARKRDKKLHNLKKKTTHTDSNSYAKKEQRKEGEEDDDLDDDKPPPPPDDDPANHDDIPPPPPDDDPATHDDNNDNDDDEAPYNIYDPFTYVLAL